MTETRFYEPARPSTPPKPLFSLKPLGANLVVVIAGDKRSPQPILGHRHSFLYSEVFPESVHILKMPVLYRLI